MTLKQLLDKGKLAQHTTSQQEVGNLLKLVGRDIADAKIKGLSNDRKFATAYNAVLQLATIGLNCKGYKTKGSGHHFTVFQAMVEVFGSEYKDKADYFDSCRTKRNLTDYTLSGGISEKEAEELLQEAIKFSTEVVGWLKKNYPAFL